MGKLEIVLVDNNDVANGNSPEKGPLAAVRTIENIRVLGLSDDDADFYAKFGDGARKKLLKKVELSSRCHASNLEYHDSIPDSPLKC